MRTTFRSPRAAAVLTVGGAALLSVPWSAAAGSETVQMRDFAFSMPALQVAVGDTVTWTNEDKALHDATTTQAPVKFASPYLKTGESWSYTFTAPGVYSYVCSLHPKMVASITAIGSAPTPTPAPVAKATAKPAARPKPTPTPAAKAAPKPSPTPKPTPTPTAKAKAPKAVAAAPAAPVVTPQATATPAAVPVSASNELDLTPAVEVGGAVVTLVVLGLLGYGLLAGRRAV